MNKPTTDAPSPANRTGNWETPADDALEVNSRTAPTQEGEKGYKKVEGKLNSKDPQTKVAEEGRKHLKEQDSNTGMQEIFRENP